MTSAQTLIDQYCESLGCRPSWLAELPENHLANPFHAKAVVDYCTKMHIAIDNIPPRIRNLTLSCLRAEIEFATKETG